MTEQTKAEQLANMPMEDRGLIWICESELELRRLSQREAQNLKLMDDLFLARAQLKEREAERDKLLEVNKVLADALEGMLAVQEENCRIDHDGYCQEHYLDDVADGGAVGGVDHLHAISRQAGRQ